MEYRRLGKTDLNVSAICLGTMTWGEQNTEADAHAQLDYALAQGINFIDTAELYPVPPKAGTYTLTEQYIGSWLKARGKRDDLIIASKIAGPTRAGDAQDYIRGGSRFTKSQIEAACDASLKRLNTDYLDLYQLHWPERKVNCFGRLGVDSIEGEAEHHALAEVLESLAGLVRVGKVRHVGLSNESPWGVMTALHAARMDDTLPRMQSVQNPYNLLNRTYEIGLSEISLREQVSLLAYSPLAFGMLSGKYRSKPWPANARITMNARFSRYTKPKAFEAVECYAKIAEDAGISLATLALAFINQRAFVTSNIIGATTMEQLAENISSIKAKLTDDTLAAIDAVHAEICNPCP